MPQYGLATSLLAHPDEAADLPPLPWRFANAEVVQVTFEVDVERALEALPAQVSRPAPPYARIITAHYPDTPFGPFDEALLLVAGRFRMVPQQVPAAVIVSSAAARDAFVRAWGLPAQLGSVALTRKQRGDGRTDLTVEIAGPRGPLAVLRLPGAYAVDAAMIRYDPFIAARKGEDGGPEIFAFSGPPEVHEARLAKGATVDLPAGAQDSPWSSLQPRNMISATFAVADIQRTAPHVLEVPARMA